MNTLDRYIAVLFLRNLSLSLAGMTALFLSQSMFTDLYDHSYTMQQVLTYHFLNVPLISVQMAPPAILLATVLTLSGLARTNELIASFAIGYSLTRLLFGLLVQVLVVSLVILVMEDRILPPIHKKRTNFYWREMKNKPDFFLDVKRDKIWYRSKNLIYNLRRFDSQTKIIHGMSIYEFDDDFNLVRTIGAEKAEFTPTGWILKNGTITSFEKSKDFPSGIAFQEKTLNISETPKEFQEIEKEVDGLAFKELKHYISRMRQAGADTKAYEVKYHSRISLSFIPIVMCFLAVPFSVGNRREGGVAKDLTLCLVITFFYWLFYSVGLSLGTNGALPPWLAAWLPSVFFVVLAATLIARKRS